MHMTLNTAPSDMQTSIASDFMILWHLLYHKNYLHASILLTGLCVMKSINEMFLNDMAAHF